MKKSEFLAYKRKARRLRRLYANIIITAIILLILTVVNLLTNPENLWVLKVAGVFALVYAILYINYLIRTKWFNKSWENKYIQKRMKYKPTDSE